VQLHRWASEDVPHLTTAGAIHYEDTISQPQDVFTYVTRLIGAKRYDEVNYTPLPDDPNELFFEMWESRMKIRTKENKITLKNLNTIYQAHAINFGYNLLPPPHYNSTSCQDKLWCHQISSRTK